MRFFVSLVLVLLLGSLGSAQNSAPSANTALNQRVDDYVRTEMVKEHIPGLALGVYGNGEIIKVQGYGLANTKTKAPVTPDTMFQSGSLGKQFTAVAVMMLVEEGKVGIDDSITKYFHDAPPSWNPIKVRNLLGHTSGIRDYENEDENIDFHKDYTWSQLLQKIESYPLNFQPGEQWRYSNTNYVLLGYLIEEVTGKFWADFEEERIFRPLDMNSMHMIGAHDGGPNFASGYTMDVSRIPVVGLKVSLKDAERVAPVFLSTADGSLTFTVADLAKWDAALYTEKLLKKSTLDQMWAAVKLNNGYANTYGFGWMIHERNGQPLLEHAGGTWGFTTHIARYPNDKLTVAVLTNVYGLLSHPGPERMAHTIAAMYDPALGPGPKPSDEPNVTALVRAFIDKTIAGKLPDGWTKDQIQSVWAYFTAVKPLRSLDLIGREPTRDRRTFVYLLTFADTEFPCKFVLDAQDRVVSLDMTY